jgi:hypothetical protein
LAGLKYLGLSGESWSKSDGNSNTMNMQVNAERGNLSDIASVAV